MEGIDLEGVAKKYNQVDEIWDRNDKWHYHTHKMIQKFVTASFGSLPEVKNLKILNAGSAGFSYGINEEIVIHVDIAKEKISHLPNFIVGNIESIPIEDYQIDRLICVGSVINYCDPIKVFEEFKRVLKRKSFIILEFENSHNFEFFGKKSFNKKAVLINTYYNGSTERIWYFSESYIREIAERFGFEILSCSRFHILSGLAYRFVQNANVAASFAKSDWFCSRIPILKRFCSNSIFLLRLNA